MQYLGYLALAASVTSALSTGSQTPLFAVDQFLVELSPGETRWVTEEEKWELRRNGHNFMDITESQHTYPQVLSSQRAEVKYPAVMQHNKTVKALAKELEKKNMRAHLEKFTSFHTRYYKSDSGRQSALWLYDQVLDTVKSSGAHKSGATVRLFDHPWGQPSIIASIPGKSNKTVIVSAHQDSINLFLPSILAAPGADDDGSGTVTILEALRVLLQSEDVAHAKADNTIEFHWYSAEEGGLLGSQAVFAAYAEDGRDVVAMLQNDMTGYTATTIELGKPESVGVVTDFVDPALTEFIKKIITTYCDIPYVLTKCGYACSDHASASKYGYPSAFVIESTFEDSNTKRIHTGNDKIEYLSFDHMLQHAKMTLAFAYELGSARL